MRLWQARTTDERADPCTSSLPAPTGAPPWSEVSEQGQSIPQEQRVTTPCPAPLTRMLWTNSRWDKPLTVCISYHTEKTLMHSEEKNSSLLSSFPRQVDKRHGYTATGMPQTYNIRNVDQLKSKYFLTCRAHYSFRRGLFKHNWKKSL